jgi:hypothetical protein
MSKVTVEILPAPTPPGTTQPRVVKGNFDLLYRFVNGRYEMKSEHGQHWLPSSLNDAVVNVLGSRDLAMMADLRANPTETITPPAGEPTVVLRMPRSTAETLTALTGNVVGAGPIRDQLDEVFDELDEALALQGGPSLFDEVTSIRQELQK